MGDSTNIGTIAGRSIVNISADNVQNLAGRINGDAVSVAALNNTASGALVARQDLQIGADALNNTTASARPSRRCTPRRRTIASPVADARVATR